MSQPRHQPRRKPKIKLRLRLPADGSVDLGKLRASLEARLEQRPGPQPEVAPDPIEPEVMVPVKPQPAPQSQPSAVWLWVSNNAPTTVCLFSAVLAFFVGLIYVGQGSTGEGNASPLLGWFFVLSICSFLVAFGIVIFRQIKREGTAAAHHWAQIKAKPTRAFVPGLIFAGVLVLVFLALTFVQSSPSEIAQGKDKTKPGTVVTPPGKQPGDSKESPLPPEVPPSKTPETKTPVSDKQVETKSLRPEEGFGGRLVGVLGMAVVMGCGLFQLKRLRRKLYPDIESFQAASKTEYFEFTRGFRTFIASQGAYLLVSAAVAIPLTFVWTGGIFSDATVPGFLLGIFLGIGVSFLIVLGAGAAGLDLMPPLDNYASPSNGGSAVIRFVKRKGWQMILGGIVLGGLGYAWAQEPLSDWVGLFLKRGLVWGQLVAVFWWSSTFWSIKVNKDRKVPVLPLKKPVKMLPTKWIPTPAFILFNLPLLIVLGCLLALVPVVFGAPARWLWLYFPLGIAVAIALSALVKRHPRLLRRWRELVFFPALVAMALGLFFGSDSFFIIFLLVLGMMVVGVSSTNSQKTEEAVKGMLILPEKRGDYSPVIHPDRNEVQIRWGSLIGVSSVVIMLLISSGSYLWSGKAALENIFHEKDPESVEVIREANLTPQPTPDFTNLSSELLKKEIVKVVASNGRPNASHQIKLIDAWTPYAEAGSLLAQYNLALAYYDWAQMEDDILLYSGIGSQADALQKSGYWFAQANEQGHELSCYNAGVLFLNRESLDEALSWFGKIKDPQILERHSIPALMDLHRKRGAAAIDILSEEGANNNIMELDRSGEITIQPSDSFNINENTD